MGLGSSSGLGELALDFGPVNFGFRNCRCSLPAGCRKSTQLPLKMYVDPTPTQTSASASGLASVLDFHSRCASFPRCSLTALQPLVALCVLSISRRLKLVNRLAIVGFTVYLSPLYSARVRGRR